MDLNFKLFLTHFNEALTFYFVFPAIVILGTYLSVKLRCVQISKLKMSFFCLLKKPSHSEGNITHYEAISSVLAGNFGTGNISGMAIALSTGGPGALVWMWIMAFLGAAIQYVSCILGIKYRKQNADGEYVGGPMYYLSDGLGYKKLAIFFSVFTILGALTVGNFAQINSVVLPLEKMGFHPLICGIIMAACVAIVLLGGIKRLAKMASFVVPIKAVLYLGAAMIILALHTDKLLPAFKLMFSSAFNPQSTLGGIFGFGVVRAISSGFDRGLFATDAGTGIVPILQSSARTVNPVIDGIVTLVAPFLVMIVCTTTGLVLLVTGVWQDPNLRSTNMVTQAFENGLGHSVGAYVVIIALILFSYTTIMAWACCAEKAMDFLFGIEWAKKFKYFYILLIPMGALIHVDLIWSLADISISLMLMTNLIGIVGLSKEVIQESKRFFLKDLELKAAGL